MNFLDVAIVLIVAASAVMGAKSGLARTAFNFAGVFGALYICLAWGGQVTGVLFDDGGLIAAAGGYAIAFLTPFIMFGFLATLARKTLRIAGLGGWDASGGTVFGAVRGFLFVCALIVPLAFTPFADSTEWEESEALPYIGRALFMVADSSPRLIYLYEDIGLDAADRPSPSALLKIREAAIEARAEEVDPQEVLDKLRRAQNAGIGSKLADEEEIINSYKKFVPFGEAASEQEKAEAMEKLRELNPESAALMKAHLEQIEAQSRGTE